MFNMNEALKTIGNLPELPRFLKLTIKEERLISDYKRFNKGVEYQLRIILDVEPLCKHDLGEDVIFCLPMAELLDALLKLCKQIHKREHNWVSCPYSIWICAVCYQFQGVAHFSGILGNPLVTNKSEYNRVLRQLIRAFEENRVDFIGNLTPEAYIFLTAQKIAKKDTPFAELIWKPFLAKWRRYLKSVKECERFRFSYSDQKGEVYSTEKWKKIPTSLQPFRVKFPKYEEILQSQQ